MRPALLQPPERPIHPGTVAVDHSRISLSQPLVEDVGSAEVRVANSVKVAAKKVQIQFLILPSLVGDSSMDKTAAEISRARRSRAVS